ncbi:MAG: hypothetical protein ACFHVJ_15865 [Aestuariibacter sp.]
MKSVFLTLLLFTSCLANAAGKWTAPGQILGSYIDTRGARERILFRHSVARTGDNCSNNGEYYQLNMENLFGNEAYALLLSAQATQQDVIVFLEGCSASGFPVATIVSTITN